MTDSNKKLIAIIGYGYVGKAMHTLFKHRSDLYDFLIIGKDDKHLHAEANISDLAIICVPTPMNSDGSCDTSSVTEVASWLKSAENILLKSTYLS